MEDFAEKLADSSLNGFTIPLPTPIRFVGFNIDHNLTFKQDISYIAKGVCHFIRVVLKVRGLVPGALKVNLYYAFINSQKNCSSSPWGVT